MQFHPTGTDPTTEARLVCRNARFNILILLAIFWGIPALWWYLEVYWLAYSCLALAVFLANVMLPIWHRRGRPENWVLAIYRDGLWLNLRDIEYHTAEPGQTIVFIPFTEIQSVRKFIHRYETPSSDGNTSHKDVYLELLLNTDEGVLVDVALKEDQQRKLPPKGCLGGFVTVSTKRGRAPVAVQGEDTLKVKFSMSNYGLTPNIRTTLAELGKYVDVEPECKEELPDLEDLNDTEFNNLVSQMVTDGRRIDAIKLLRTRKQMTTTEAMNFLDELQRQLNEPPPE